MSVGDEGSFLRCVTTTTRMGLSQYFLPTCHLRLKRSVHDPLKIAPPILSILASHIDSPRRRPINRILAFDFTGRRRIIRASTKAETDSASKRRRSRIRSRRRQHRRRQSNHEER